MRTLYDDLMQKEQIKIDGFFWSFIGEIEFEEEERFRIVPIGVEKQIILRLRQRAYLNTFKGKVKKRLKDGERRARKKGIIHSFTFKEWSRKLEETGGICPGCKNHFGIKKLTLDHIFPVSKAEAGRVYTINEVQPLCKSCNSSKGANLEW